LLIQHAQLENVVFSFLRVDGVYSEPFPSHDEARRAAELAAKEQVVPGDTTDISYEDKEGRWHNELSKGSDRPETDVEG
jgi:hypothetical protein